MVLWPPASQRFASPCLPNGDGAVVRGAWSALGLERMKLRDLLSNDRKHQHCKTATGTIHSFERIEEEIIWRKEGLDEPNQVYKA